SQRAALRPHATPGEMADATFALYDAALAQATEAPPCRPLDPVRLRYALHYREWQPPPVAVAPPAGETGLLSRVAGAAARRRHTLMGRVLYRLAPAGMVARLRERLKP
ncbi:MAG: hypothetical protein U1E86_22975, partial [Burkholderiaceae bacterium]